MLIVGDGRYVADPEVLLDIGTNGLQHSTSVSRLSNGGLVAVWLDNGFIAGQVFDPFGNAVGLEFKVAHTTPAPTVAGLAGGGFVVGWTGVDQSGAGAKGQVFNDSGVAVSNVISLNANSLGNQSGVTLRALSGGGFVAGWAEHDEAYMSSSVEARIFNVAGDAVSADISVAAPGSGFNSPTITELVDGNIAIAYWGGTGSTAAVINGRVYDATGTATGAIFSTSGLTSYPSAYSPSLITLLSGNMVLAWVAHGQGGPVAVMAQIFSASGAAIGAPLTVSTSSTGNVSLAATPQGFAIVYGKPIWNAFIPGQNPVQIKIAAQLYDESGGPLGPEFVVNTLTRGDQHDPRITTFGSNDLAITFTDHDTSGNGNVQIRLLFNTRIEGGGGDDTLSGTGAGDSIYGYDGNDILNGAGGDDLLFGGADDDTLTGGAGYDVAVFNSFFRASTVTVGASVSISSSDGEDTATGIERFDFSDGSFFADADSTGAQIMRLCSVVFDREVDATGLDYWVDRIEDNGLSLNQVANYLATSPEFMGLTGGLTNAQFVDYVYEHALGRAPDADGRAYWIGKLDGGTTRGDMLVGFSESDEHKALTAELVSVGYFQTDDIYQAITLFYDSFADRLPDRDGLTYWAELVKSGATTLEQVAAGFAGSAEFQQRTAGMNNGQLVDFMYENTLDRLPDAEGRQFWVSHLDSGAVTLGQLLYGFSQSAEHNMLLAPQIVGGIDYFA